LLNFAPIHEHDVAVIGAGPVGSYCALELARNGLDVLVLEKNLPGQYQPVCSGVIGTEAFTEFPLSVDSIVNKVREIVLVSPSGQKVAYHPATVQAYVVNRTMFDEQLRSLTRSNGAEIREGLTCTALEVTDRNVRLRGSSSGQEFRAKVAIIASGYNPALTKMAGLGTVLESVEGVQAEVEADDLKQTEVYLGNAVAPSSFAWLVGLQNGKARVGLTSQRQSLSFLRSFLNSPPLEGRVRLTGKAHKKTIPYGLLKKSFGNRLVVVGEAAGQVKTTTHGGIYYGLICARFAVETLVEAWKKQDFSAATLAEYERRWRQLLEPEILKGIRFRRFFSHLTDGQIEWFFKMSQKDGIMDLLHKKARFDWHGEFISSLIQHAFFRNYFGKEL
jgi:digeranylgeranylglycerophospholipid reductase